MVTQSILIFSPVGINWISLPVVHINVDGLSEVKCLTIGISIDSNSLRFISCLLAIS